MFSGAQISLCPMIDDFVGVITSALGALDPCRTDLRIETDDFRRSLSARSKILFQAMRYLFSVASGKGVHCMLSATISRGCRGALDDA